MFTVNFIASSTVSKARDQFFANDTNKQRFITALVEYLTSINIDAWQSNADADVDIVNAAIDFRYRSAYISNLSIIWLWE